MAENPQIADTGPVAIGQGSRADPQMADPLGRKFDAMGAAGNVLAVWSLKTRQVAPSAEPSRR